MGRNKPQEGLKAEYSGRASAKGKVGTSGAFPENGKCVCPEQSEPRRRGRSRAEGWPLCPVPAHCGSRLWPRPGSRNSDSGNKKKKEKIWPLYCPKSPPGNSGEQPGLGTTRVAEKNAFYSQCRPGFKSQPHLLLTLRRLRLHLSKPQFLHFYNRDKKSSHPTALLPRPNEVTQSAEPGVWNTN